jgi:hypothetical protein
MVILRHYSVCKRTDKPKKDKNSKIWEGRVHIGMVPAKQLHLPVMGVSMLSGNLQRLHGHCIPASRDSASTNSIQSVANTTKLKNINNFFFPICFSFICYYQGEINKNTHLKYRKNTMFTNLCIIITHVG